MHHFIRLYRLQDTEIWEVRFQNHNNVYCYFSITDMRRKATVEDNPLATAEELDSRDNYISIDVHSNTSLQSSLSEEEYEDFIEAVSSFVESTLHNAFVFFNFHSSYKIDEKNIKFYEDEDLYGSKEEQIEEYKEQNVKEHCIKLVEKIIKRSLDEVSDSHFSQDKK